MVDSKRYVVLDVETNGLSSLKDDLLSISIFMPDKEKKYVRFLPLELQTSVYTTYINGITEKDLESEKPLNQAEVDKIFRDFELDRRIILTFGDLDEKFINSYFARHLLDGWQKLHFYNFQKDIFKANYSNISLTKDTICRLLGIDGVKDVHEGINDCILEWQIFEKMDGKKMMYTPNHPFELLDNDFLVPAVWHNTYHSLKRMTKLSSITVNRTKIYEMSIQTDSVPVIHADNVQYAIGKKLNASLFDYESFEENNGKLRYIVGTNIPAPGRWWDRSERIKSLLSKENNEYEIIAEELSPLISFIKDNVFNNNILLKEVVKNKEHHTYSVCNLSNNDSILLISHSGRDFEKDLNYHKYDFFVQSLGRNIYFLKFIFGERISKYCLYKIELKLSNSDHGNFSKEFEKKITNKNIELILYNGTRSDAIFSCKICGNNFKKRPQTFINNQVCPFCNKTDRPKSSLEGVIINEDAKTKRKNRFINKIIKKYNGQYSVVEYKGAKEMCVVKCKQCGNTFERRADHLLDRYCNCPNCNKL